MLATQIELLDVSMNTSITVVELALNWLLQSTLLLAIGLTLGRLLRQRGSAVQSVVYRTTLAAVLICPLVTWGLSQAGVSGWSIELRESPQGNTLAFTNQKYLLVDNDLTDSMDDPRIPTESHPSGGQPISEDLAPEDLAHEDSALQEAQPPLPLPLPYNEPVSSEATNALSASTSLLGLVALAAVVGWLLFSLTRFTRLASAWRQLAQLRKRAVCADGEIIRACRRLASTLQVSPPEVLRSPCLPSPCLAGLRRPAVLLPEDGASLSIREVLVHELAHLKRHDCHWNLLRQVATALLPFQPLLWVLSRRIEATAEEVCDDYVVHHGGDRGAYAHRLVDVAELSIAPIAAAGVGMVSFRSMLAQRVARIMDTSRTLSTRVGNLLLAAVLIGGLVGTTVTGLVGLAPRASQAEEEAVANGEPVSEDEDLITIRGTVVDPEGVPVEKATVRLTRWYWGPDVERKPLNETLSDEKGQFEITYRKSQFNVNVHRPAQWKEVAVSAFKSGYGPGWVGSAEIPRGEQARLQLAKDDQPITGRVVDLEGQPLAGVKVSIGQLANPKGNDLSDWIQAVQQGEPPWLSVKKIRGSGLPFEGTGLPRDLVTDAQGRFRLNGIGRERKVDLVFEGPHVTRTSITAVTRKMAPLLETTVLHKEFAKDNKRQVLGADFEIALPPTQVIEGVVRDADSGKPMEGVDVYSWQFAGTHVVGERLIQSETDKQGRFRLVGMPQGAGNSIAAFPNDDQPYFIREVEVPYEEGTESSNEPIVVDIELHRGVWITGRVTNQVTGDPVPWARLMYLPFRANEYAQAIPEFDSDGNVDGTSAYQSRYLTSEDGTYRLVGLPGRAILGVQAIEGDYCQGKGAREIAGLNENGNSHFETFRNPINPGLQWPTVMREIYPDEGVDSIEFDFELDPGEEVKITTVDPRGKPIDGVSVTGFASRAGRQIKMEAANFSVTTFGPNEIRTMLFHHKEQNLGKVARVQAAGQEEAVSVQLEPCAKILGQLVNEEGLPISGAEISMRLQPQVDFGKELLRISTDAEGRFEHDGVLPGATYNVQSESPQAGFSTLAKDLVVHPGETIDLGTIDISQDERPEPVRTLAALNAKDPLKSDTTDKSLVAGKVVDADGKPVAGAKFYWMRSRSHDLDPMQPRLIATSDAAGNYQFNLPSLGSAADVPANRDYLKWMVVRAPGHGVLIERPGNLLHRMHRLGRVGETEKGATIKLPEAGDSIRGRLVDEAGQPIAGATVRIRWLTEGDSHERERLDEEIRDPENGEWRARITKLLGIIEPVSIQYALPMATTDAQGHFELRDIGPKRLFQLLVEGEGIASTQILARNEPGAVIEIPAPPHRIGATHKVYGQDFLHMINPSNPVQGRVVDIDTGEPIANAIVRAVAVHGERLSSSRGREHLSTRTDAEGRYQITGLPAGEGNRLVALTTGEEPFVPVGHKVDTSGEGVIAQDFQLLRGVWAEGRVFDQESDKPFTGEILYYYFQNKDLEKAVPGLRRAHVDRLYWTNANGEFRVPVLPTRGILAFRYEGRAFDRDGIDRYSRGYGADSIDGIKDMGGWSVFPTRPSELMPDDYNRLIEVNPTADQTVVRADMRLASSRAIKIRVAPTGTPPNSLYKVYGATRMWGWQRMDTPEFEIKGLMPGERRKVFVFHRGPNLAGGVIVDTTNRETVSIQLQQAGSLVGRLVDSAGKPITDASLSCNLGKLNADEETAIWAPHPKLRSNPTTIPVDSDGRFRVDGLIPGWEYNASAAAQREWRGVRQNMGIGIVFADEIIEPGEDKDLGDIVIESKGFLADKEAQVNERSEPVRSVTATVEKADEAKESKGRGGEQAKTPEETDRESIAKRYECQLLDIVSKQPIVGATVTVQRRIRGGGKPFREWPVQRNTDYTTDSNGRYTIDFLDNEVDESLLYVEITTKHADFMKWYGGYSYTMIKKNQEMGSEPFFASISLWPATQLTGTVVTPDGKPAVGVDVHGYSKFTLGKVDGRGSFLETKTNEQGLFQLNGVRGGRSVVWISPKDYSPSTHVLHSDSTELSQAESSSLELDASLPSASNDVAKTRDLGEFVLEKGIEIRGQVVDVEGLPVEGVWVNAELSGGPAKKETRMNLATQICRSALTDADGRYRMGPLPPSDYRVTPWEEPREKSVGDSTVRPVPGEFFPQQITLEEGMLTETVDFQAVPHVTLVAQYYRSSGEPRSGHAAFLSGKHDDVFYWKRCLADANGRIEFSAPRGLQKAKIMLSTNEHSALRHRLTNEGPLLNANEIDLGTLTTDIDQIAIIRYAAPILLIKATDETGQLIEDAWVTLKYAPNRSQHSGEFIRNDRSAGHVGLDENGDGRWRTSQLLPDEEFTLAVEVDGYELHSEKLSLPEGETREIVVELKKSELKREQNTPE